MADKTESIKTGFQMDSTFAKRTLCFCFGLAVNSFGIALITRSGLGATQISSLPYAWSLATPAVSYALATFIVNMGFFAMEAILVGRKFFPLQLFQVVANIIFSSFLGLSMQLLAFWQPSMLPLQIAGVLAGCCILGTGIAIECSPHLTYVPGEGIVRVLADILDRKLGTVKLVFDAVLVASAIALSFAVFGELEGVGVGTILTVLITGNIVNFADAHLPLVGRMRELACA